MGDTATKTLPPGWRMVHFGDVVRNMDVNDRNPLENGLERYIGLEHIEPESLHIKRWGLIEEGTSFTRKFVKRQVLFGKRRVYQRKAAIAEFDGICSSDILVFEPKNEELISELLPFIVQSDGFFNHALDTSAGSLSPRTKWKDLAAYDFALPPKDEQRRIADILWAVDEAIERTKAVVLHTELSKEISLSAILNQEQSLNPLLKFAYLETNYKWQYRKLEEVCQQITDGTHFTPTYTNTGIPFLRVTDIQTPSIDWRQVKYISEQEHETLIKRCCPKRGDVLLSKNGTVGIAKVVDWDEPFSIFVSLCLLKPGADIDPYYLCEVIRLKIVQSQFNLRSKQGTVKNLHLEEIRNCIIPVPPLAEQQEIVLTARRFDSSLNTGASHFGRYTNPGRMYRKTQASYLNHGP